ncbi:umecyanin-like [Argentina anserina]|uniref:umecyanin-like n=1 Tax=Argentina anserina TaxID=57926 RepID=UPI0021763F5F|nr:umecyanin-like [Potentilla anserina]
MNMKYVIVLVIAIAAIAEGAEYTVGDAMGWMVPPTPDYYDKWVSKYNFVENDTLVFNFEQGKHDITVLSKEDFDSCNMNNPLFQFPEPGDVGVMASGTFYFTCSFGEHCASGQKFAIFFASAPVPPSPSPCPKESVTTDQLTQSRKFKEISVTRKVVGL